MAVANGLCVSTETGDDGSTSAVASFSADMSTALLFPFARDGNLDRNSVDSSVGVANSSVSGSISESV